MSPELEKRIEEIALDRESGASELLAAAIGVLRDALSARADVRSVADAIRRAQPSMAPLWNAARAAVAAIDEPMRFERFAHRVERAPGALARFAVDVLETGVSSGATLGIVTLSSSGTVLHVIEALAARRTLRVACAEGRPALEGRRLATRLAAAGIPVLYYSDAAIGNALDTADVVLVGADAVAPDWFLNKSGTRLLAASAAQRGVPAYVLASREKFVSQVMADRLTARSGPAAEVWPDPPPGVEARNPYFERTPLELVAGVITDIGLLGTSTVAEVCEGARI